jgi:hypothetical protein
MLTPTYYNMADVAATPFRRHSPAAASAHNAARWANQAGQTIGISISTRGRP